MNAITTFQFLSLVCLADAQTNPGFASSTSCPSTITACNSSSMNWFTRSLTYSNTTGLFTGTITGNQCPGQVTTFAQGTPNCFTQTFPQYTTSKFPVKVPFGALGYSLDGMNIYSALENGFSYGVGATVCSSTSYYCAGGADLDACIGELKYTCGSASVSTSGFGDTCGGHATPYHFHVDLSCSYSPNAAASASSVTTHSPLIGVALDGRGIYGAWESSNTLPTLDACNGHTGTTPGTASMSASGSALTGITGLASSAVYHYHLTTFFPYTLGCFGSSTVSYSSCTALYSTCKTYIPYYAANGSWFFYDDWCPCGNGGSNGPMILIGSLPPSGSTCSSNTKGAANFRTNAVPTATCSLSMVFTYSDVDTNTAVSASTEVKLSGLLLFTYASWFMLN